MSGQIVDATIVAAPKQRNTIEEKKAIREGRVPDDWKDKPAKLAQKVRDARWTVKYTKAKPREDGQGNYRFSTCRAKEPSSRYMIRVACTADLRYAFNSD